MPRRLAPTAVRWRIQAAARAVRAGGVIAYPTEAVFGLGCAPLDEAAVKRLLNIKQRPVHKGLILIAVDFAQLRPFVAPVEAKAMKRVWRTWPGPHTWLLPAAPGCPRWLRGRHSTLAVRVTAHPIAAALCQTLGTPLVSTSANLAGHPPVRTASEARRRFGRVLDAILVGPCGGAKRPTPIRDARTGKSVRA